MEKFNLKIETVFVRVSDIKKSFQWYKNVLKANMKWKKENIVAFSLGDVELVLTQQRLEKFNDVTYNLLTNDIDQFIKHLETLNVRVEKKQWDNLFYIEFLDLDENKIQVIQRI